MGLLLATGAAGRPAAAVGRGLAFVVVPLPPLPLPRPRPLPLLPRPLPLPGGGGGARGLGCLPEAVAPPLVVLRGRNEEDEDDVVDVACWGREPAAPVVS